MWWAIGIIGGVCIVAFLWFVFVSGAKGIAAEADKKSILDVIAKEYLVRRQNGETLDQIANSLYQQYHVSRPIDILSGHYNPMPPGQSDSANLMKQIPEEGKQLGKIAYTVLCHGGVYPMPQPGQDRRNSTVEFSALTGIARACMAQIEALEAAGGKINEDLRAMVSEWAEAHVTIYLNATGATRPKAVSP